MKYSLTYKKDMRPRIIVHNTISLDGSIKDFELDIGLHYEIAGKINADAHLIGSETAWTGVKNFTEEIPAETEEDFTRPEIKPEDKRPLWIIPDSHGRLKGLLHVYRRSCFCREVIIIVTRNTPEGYLQYLKDREYDYIISGVDHVDYQDAFDRIFHRYDVRTMLTDSGGILTGILFQEGLIDEVSLLITPTIVGEQSTNLFRTISKTINLELIRTERIRNNHLLVLYRVINI